MKLEERIEELNSNMNDEKTKEEALKLKSRLSFFGMLFVIVGFIGVLGALTVFIVFSTINIVNKKFDLYFLIPLAGIIPFSALFFLGLVYRRLATAIKLEDEKK